MDKMPQRDEGRLPLTRNDPPAVSQQPQTVRPSRRAPRHSAGSYVRSTAIVGALALFAAAGSFAGNLYWHSPWIRHYINNFFAHPSTIIPTIVSSNPLAPYTPDRTFPAGQQSALTVLILGCDADYYDNRPVPIPGMPGRSDTTMVARCDFTNNRLDILSIPRDTAVRIPGYKGVEKVNAAHEFGGNKLTGETIRDDFGIDPNYAVALHFDSFQKLVDAVGGVNLFVDKKLDYDDNWANLHVHLNPGYQHLNGYHAMGYVRIRHCDNDLQRVKRQQEFLEALRKQVMSPSNFLRLPTALQDITSDLQTDLNEDQMLTLVHWAAQLPKQNIHVATLPSVEGRSYVYTEPEAGAATIARIFYGGDESQVHLNVVSRAEMVAIRNRVVEHRRFVYRRRRLRIRGRARSTHAPAGAGISPASATPEPQVSPTAAPAQEQILPPANSGGAGDSTGSPPHAGMG